MKKQFIISEAEAGQRLDMAVSKLAGISRSQIQKLFDQDAVLIDDVAAKPSQLSVAGQTLVVDIPELKEMELISPEQSPKILYEDEDILAIDKPAGLSVHASESGRVEPTVAGFAKKLGIDPGDEERPGIVHRLDKDTSGILLLAKNAQAKEYLQKLFRERKVVKTYLALVQGHMRESEATIKLPIGRNPRIPTKRTVLPGARPAITHYRVLEQLPHTSLLEIGLETGRTHQIRVHFSHLGHPVVGDVMYGSKKTPGLPRQFLHASKIELVLPSGKTLAIESKLPPDLQAYLENQEREI